MYCNTRPPYNNELYHHGVKGMHWGVRRFQPYRKGDKVKGGKEIGKAAKVEQRSLADRVKKGIAAVNKIKKELHKGKLEKAEYKYEMTQLKDARKEVKKARRRQAEERIRERIREHREEERENKRLEEERRDRNLERAKGIAESAAQIGALAYSAYQLKKRMQDNGILGSSGGPAAPGSSSPTIHTPISSSSHSGPTHTLSTPASSSSSSSSSSHPLTIHTSGSHSQPTGTTLPTALRGNTSQSIRESRKSTITNNLNRAIQNLSSKSNKSDSDTYALLSLRALQQRVNNTDSNSNAFNSIDHLAGLTPEQLIRRQREISHEDTDQNELYHHGVLGMHWGIRRYQPYRKGERVKGGKEVGEATKVDQRPVSYKTKFKVNRKLSKNNDKILKLRAKQYGKSFGEKNKIAKKIMKIRKKNSKLNDKAGYSNTMETEEYRRELDRVSSGGVDKTVDAAAKKAALAKAHREKNPSMQSYRAYVKAHEALIDAQNEYMKKTGIQRYNKDQLSQAVNSYQKATNSSKKALDDFTSKKFTKEMQNEYHTMRSTDPKFKNYQALNKELYELKVSYNNDLARERLWSEELKKLK